MLRKPLPSSRALWDLRREGGPVGPKLWTQLSAEGRQAWLEVSRHADFVQRSVDSPPGSTFVLDTTDVVDEPGFHCAMGEAINGPGGYFGNCLDALADCLHGGFGATPPFTLVWLGRKAVEAKVGTSFLETILGLFAARSIKVVDGDEDD
nr:barstar family protein [Nocardia sp. CDC159]